MVVDNDVTRSTFGAWFRRSYPAYDPVAVQRFWDRRGFTTEHLTIAWTFDRRNNLKAMPASAPPARPTRCSPPIGAWSSTTPWPCGGSGSEPPGGVRTVPSAHPAERVVGRWVLQETTNRRQTVGTRTDVDSATSLTLPVTGMTCASCEKRVREALRTVPGVQSVRVSAARGTATVRGDEPLDRDLLDAAVRSAGYEPGTTPWLTRDPSVWRTVVVAAVADLAYSSCSASGIGLTDLTSGLSDPGAAACSSCSSWARRRGVDLHGHGRRAGARVLGRTRRGPRRPR